MTHSRPVRSTVRPLLANFAAVVAAAALLFVALSPARVSAAGLVVNSAADNATADDDLCTLREAIINANANGDATSGDCAAGNAAGVDQITFNIPDDVGGLCSAANACRLFLTSSLPAITDAAGLTISGSNGKLTIDGANAYRILDVSAGAQLTVQSLTFQFGRATGIGENGGAIRSAGALLISASTFTRNYADNQGGAIASSNASLEIVNSTFSSNGSGNEGGALFLAGGTLKNNTFRSNNGDDQVHTWSRTGGTLTVTNNIFADGGTSGCDGLGTLTDGGGNLTTHASCPGTVVTLGSLEMDSLRDGNGPTPVHPLLLGSVAIDAAGDCNLVTDQRGIVRPQGDACDTGAVEAALQPGPTVVVNDASEGNDLACDLLNPGVTECTLREAVYTAEKLPGPNTITFNIPDSGASAAACSADNVCTIFVAGRLSILSADGLTIDGAGADITLDGFNTHGLVQVGQTGVLTIDSLVLTRGAASVEGGAIAVEPGGRLTVANSTISNSSAGVYGGAIEANSNAVVTVTHSTLSGNSAIVGGGIFFGRGPGDGALTVINSTLSGNTATGFGGGGLYLDNGTATLTNTTLSGNSAAGGVSGAIYNEAETLLEMTNSLLVGGDTVPNCAGVTGTMADATNIADDASCGDATEDTTLGSFLGPLADNGGPTLTHALLEGSEAIDFNAQPCAVTADQRGVSRPQGSACDAGAFEAAPSGGPLVFAAAAAGTANNDTEPDVAYQTGDVLKWDGDAWTKYFDGTDNGLPASADLIALDVDDQNDCSIYLTWRQEIANVPGIGRARPWEVQHFDGSTFSRFFDGRDVGLTLASERINGLEVLDGSESPIGTGCDAYLLISTMAGGTVSNSPGPVIKFTGEDVLGFCATDLGADTTGLWHLVLDGQPYGVPRNQTVGLAASDDAGTLWFTTKATFAAGKNKFLPFELPTGPLSTTPVFDATAVGLAKLVDSIDYEE